MNFIHIVLLLLLVHTCYQTNSQTNSQSNNNQTKDTDELFELSSTSTLLVPHDRISN